MSYAKVDEIIRRAVEELVDQLADTILKALDERTFTNDPAGHRALLDWATMSPAARIGVDGPHGEIGIVRDRLAAAVREADSTALFHRTRRSQGRPGPLGPLAQLAAVEGLGPESSVRLRGALEARLEGSRLSTRVGWLDFPEADLSSVRCVLDGEAHTADELGLDLTERLLRAGVLVPAGR